MRIGIDARLWGQGGLGRYIEQLVLHLEKIDTDNQYVVFLKKENWDRFQPKSNSFVKVLADFKWYGLQEQVLFPNLIRKQKLKLMHFPHFNVSIFCPVPFIVTIHDLILIKYPSIRATTLGPWMYWCKKTGYHIVIKTALRRAKKIITVSRFSKSEIVQTFKNINPEKIVVTYEGLTSLKTSGKKITDSDKTKLFKYNIKKPYILYVGSAYPHKNLEGLLLAFAALLEKGYDMQLVLVWKDDYFYRRLKQHAIGLKIWGMKDQMDRVIFTGYVSDDDLSYLYHFAKLYVFPSFYEGFGLPPLEAMAHRVPVVSSRIPCLEEILDDAVYYFDPSDPKNIELALEYILSNKDVQKELIQKGLKQIQKYDWNKCATKTLEIYNSVLDKL